MSSRDSHGWGFLTPLPAAREPWITQEEIVARIEAIRAEPDAEPEPVVELLSSRGPVPDKPMIGHIGRTCGWCGGAFTVDRPSRPTFCCSLSCKSHLDWARWRNNRKRKESVA